MSWLQAFRHAKVLRVLFLVRWWKRKFMLLCAGALSMAVVFVHVASGMTAREYLELSEEWSRFMPDAERADLETRLGESALTAPASENAADYLARAAALNWLSSKRPEDAVDPAVLRSLLSDALAAPDFHWPHGEGYPQMYLEIPDRMRMQDLLRNMAETSDPGEPEFHDLLRLAKRIQSSGGLLALLTGNAFEMGLHEKISERLDHLSDQQTEDLHRLVEQLGPPSTIPDMLAHERRYIRDWLLERLAVPEEGHENELPEGLRLSTVVLLGDHPLIGIEDRHRQVDFLLEPGIRRHGWELIEFNPQKNEAIIAHGDRRYQLRLKPRALATLNIAAFCAALQNALPVHVDAPTADAALSFLDRVDADFALLQQVGSVSLSSLPPDLADQEKGEIFELFSQILPFVERGFSEHVRKREQLLSDLAPISAP